MALSHPFLALLFELQAAEASLASLKRQLALLDPPQDDISDVKVPEQGRVVWEWVHGSLLRYGHERSVC